MLVIGLTGGIATGKSTVCLFLNQQYNIPIIDADLINKQLLEPNQAGYHAILKSFPNIPLLKHQQLDKHYLRQIIFNDPEKKKTLENILHPLIKQTILNSIHTLNKEQHSCCVVAIPLLIEAHFEELVDTIWVTDCSEEIQLQRLLTRDTISKSLAQSMINSQLTRKERLIQADAIIPTNNCELMKDTLITLLKNI